MTKQEFKIQYGAWGMPIYTILKEYKNLNNGILTIEVNQGEDDYIYIHNHYYNNLKEYREARFKYYGVNQEIVYMFNCDYTVFNKLNVFKNNEDRAQYIYWFITLDKRFYDVLMEKYRYTNKERKIYYLLQEAIDFMGGTL